MSEPRGVERLWFSADPGARAARLALIPLEIAYGGIVAARGALYDVGVLPTRASAIPALSVGNLTVGGTGKTPVSAWLVGELTARGARPAIVLRGYGSDEQLVHGRLNPGVPVVVSPDRLAGIERAAERGADIAVLDDAFQHRRARRAADVVLVSADRWTERRRLLPAGPWREPLGALRRASLVIVTRKAAALDDAKRVEERVRRAAPAVESAIMHLGLGDLHVVQPGTDAAQSNGVLNAGHGTMHDCAASASGAPGAATRTQAAPIPASALAGQRILAISAIGDASAFTRQLASLGALVEPRSFVDHHQFTAGDAARLAMDAARMARDASEAPAVAVCTLKDAVKLAPLWPREVPPLWYVSQQPEVESGRVAVDALLTAMLAATHRQP